MAQINKNFINTNVEKKKIKINAASVSSPMSVTVTWPNGSHPKHRGSPCSKTPRPHSRLKLSLIRHCDANKIKQNVKKKATKKKRRQQTFRFAASRQKKQGAIRNAKNKKTIMASGGKDDNIVPAVVTALYYKPLDAPLKGLARGKTSRGMGVPFFGGLKEQEISRDLHEIEKFSILSQNYLLKLNSHLNNHGSAPMAGHVVEQPERKVPRKQREVQPVQVCSSFSLFSKNLQSTINLRVLCVFCGLTFLWRQISAKSRWRDYETNESGGGGLGRLFRWCHWTERRLERRGMIDMLSFPLGGSFFFNSFPFLLNHFLLIFLRRPVAPIRQKLTLRLCPLAVFAIFQARQAYSRGGAQPGS